MHSAHTKVMHNILVVLYFKSAIFVSQKYQNPKQEDNGELIAFSDGVVTWLGLEN